MNSSVFALGIGVRAILVGAIAFAVIELLTVQRLYAVALVVAGIGALIVADLVRCVLRGDRLLERFVEGLAAGDFEQPAPPGIGAGFFKLRSGIERAAAALNLTRTARQRQIDHLQTLIDTVSVALLVAQPDGSVTLSNRAARKLAGREVRRLEQLTAADATTASRLLALAPGERRIFRLASGQRVLVSAARFSAEGLHHQVLSLQNIESELDAVEVQAWQELVRILAHEMMNSLTPISSLAESLRPLLEKTYVAGKGSGSSQDRDDIHCAIDAISRRSSGLMSFVERYRKMTDLPPVRLAPVRIDELVQRLDRLMQAMLAEKNIQYASHIGTADLVLSADIELLEQCLINILHNAVDAVGGVADARIALDCELRGERAAIRIADNGQGIDGAHLERIFVPFFTTKPGGSGIGLSLARQIALAHRGQLEVAANRPTGAAFTLLLPLVRQ